MRSDVEPLERREIERAIPLQRAAERRTVLLLRVRGFLAIDRLASRIEALEVILRIERGVAKEEEHVARHRVRAALGHDVDHAAGCLAELGCIGVGEHLEFAHRLLAERRAHAPDARVVVVEPVDGDVVRSCALPGERQPRRARRTLLRRAVGRDTRREKREADEIPAVDRQMLNLRLRNHIRDDSTLRVNDWRVSRHEHGLLTAGDIQRQADVDEAAKRQHDVVERSGRESLQFGAHGVCARGQRRNQEMPTLIRDRAAGVVGFDVLRRDSRARKHCGRLIDDRPAKIASRGTSLPCRGS